MTTLFCIFRFLCTFSSTLIFSFNKLQYFLRTFITDLLYICATHLSKNRCSKHYTSSKPSASAHNFGLSHNIPNAVRFARALAVVVMVAVGSSVVRGQTTVNYAMSTMGLANSTAVGITTRNTTDGNITFTFAQNSSGTAPSYFTTGTMVRLYQNATKGGSIKIMVASGYKITSATVTKASGDGDGPVGYAVDGSTEAGSFADGTTSNTTGAINATSSIEFYSKGTSASTRFYLVSFSVTYVATTSPPTITVGSVTAFGNQCINTNSANKTYNVSGSNLTANISISAPSGFEVSTSSGSGFGSSVTLNQSGGTVASTPIYVRFAPTLAQAYSGNISHTSTSATTQNVAVSGIGVNTAPTITTSAATSINTSGATVPGTITNTGCTAITAYGVEYSTTSGFADGAGTQVVGTNLSSGSFSVNITSLASGTTYYYKTYATNGGGTSYSSQSSFTTLKLEPTHQVTNFAVGAVTTGAIPLTWTAAAAGSQAPDGYLIKTSTSTITDPVDGTDPANVTAITSGVANKKQTTGTSTSTTSFTSMAAGTMYNYKIYSYTNTGAAINFNTTSPPAINHATLANASTGASFTATGTTTASLSWTAASGYNSTNHTTLVFVKAASAITVGTPTNAPSTYTANSDFSGAATAYQGDASAKCVYKGDGTSISITGLTANTTYHILILNVVDASNSNATNSYSAGLVASATTAKFPPTTQAHTLTFSSVSSNGMTVNCTNGNGDGRIILINNTNSFTDPVNGTPQSGTTAYSGTGQQCVYSGSGSTVNITGLSQNTTYYFRVYEYNNLGTNISYNTETASDNPKSQTTNPGPCLSEGFDNGTSAPTGWTFTGIGTYTSVESSGTASPSLRFDDTGEKVETATVSNATELKFWIKGQGTIASSALLVEGYNGSSWSTIENITNSIPTSGTVKTYNASSTPALASGFTKFRFTFTKTTGNLAFDDVEITCVSDPIVTVTESALDGFSYVLGNGPSNVQSFNVMGISLTHNIVINAPTNYEISTASGSGFGSSLTLTQTGGAVASTPIYVRLKAGLSIAAYNAENINISSTDAPNVIVSCSGAVKIATPVALAATSVKADSFKAHWNAVSGASGYRIDAYEKQSDNPTDLFITEYIEGGGTEKYIEIYNGTTATIDLSDYKLQLYTNGVATVYQEVNLAGNLASGSTIVYRNSSATLYPTATVSAVANFSGNDAVAIYKISTSSFVDIFGRIGEDPGSHWSSVSNQTKVKTLVRKSTVTGGVTTNPTAGFPTLESEWTQYDVNTITNLGSHTCDFESQSLFIDNADMGNVLEYVVSGLDEDATYYYVVRAYEGSNTSANSNEIQHIYYWNGTTSNAWNTASNWDTGELPTADASIGIRSDAANDCLLNTDHSVTDIVLNSTSRKLNPNTHKLVIKGAVDFKTNAEIDAKTSGSTIELAGTVAQSIDEDLYVDAQIFNLVIDNSVGVSQDCDITVLNNFTINSGKKHQINTSKSLTVNGSAVNNAGVEGLTIKANNSGRNGSFIFPQGQTVQATVEFFSKASWDLNAASGSKYKWQYFGIPFSSSLTASPSFDGAFVRKYQEAGTGAGTNNTPIKQWLQLTNNVVLTAFSGYQIVQSAAKTYYLKGTLVNDDFNSGQLAFTTTGAANPGRHIFSNPYTAAIAINQIDFGSETEATVYLYNTGSSSDWNSNKSNFVGAAPGRYTSVPKNHSGGEFPNTIPSLQGFLIKKKNLDDSNLTNFTFNIPYNAVKTKNTENQRIKAADLPMTIIDVSGSQFVDRVWIATHPDATNDFDNGWDGRKIMGASIAPHLMVRSNAIDYQIHTTNDINNAELVFVPGIDDTHYTITIKHKNSYYPSLYLVDMHEGIVTDISADSTSYSFNQLKTSTIEPRFKIVSTPEQTTNTHNTNAIIVNPISVFKNNIIVDNRNNESGILTVFDCTGKLIFRNEVNKGALYSNTINAAPGTYLVKFYSKQNIITRYMIIQPLHNF